MHHSFIPNESIVNFDKEGILTVLTDLLEKVELDKTQRAIRITELRIERDQLCEALKHRLNIISFKTEILPLAIKIEAINEELREIKK